jgi:diguanylate cyclase (GGDEF)-like protein/PAS domain S-box-containing protein
MGTTTSERHSWEPALTAGTDPGNRGAPDASARERILGAALDAVLAALGRSDRVTVGLALGSDTKMTLLAARGAHATELEGVEIALAELSGAARESLVAGHLVTIDGGSLLGSQPGRGGLRRKTPHLALVPLVISGEVRGLLVVESPTRPRGAIATQLEAIATLVAPAIESIRLTADLYLYQSQERFRSIVQNSSDVVTLVDADMTIRYQTPSVERLIGYDPAELLGVKLTELLHPDDALHALAFFCDALASPGVTAATEWRMRHRDGTWLYVETVGNNLLDDPNVAQMVLNSRDVTDRKTLEEQLSHQAFHDSLTGLANRALFRNHVERALLHRKRAEEPFAVLFLDLDGFKMVNDSLGHKVGDELLVAVAERLKACVRPADTAARLGGDEFAVLLEDVTEIVLAEEIAQRIIEAMMPAFPLDGKQAVVGTSIGIALSEQGESADELLRNADIAMYIAKRSGKGRHAAFEKGMHEEALERLELESNLRRALDREELVLHYQPIVGLRSAQVVGVEALVRWQHPERGLLPPGAFIALAEETGLIVPIGTWILYEACLQTARIHLQDRDEPPLYISVNISGKQLEDPTFVQQATRAIERSGIDPRTVTVEITESVMMRDTDATVKRLQALRDLGVRVAIDDFGTGYSSLRYLNTFPVDILKIAREFVEGLDEESQEANFVRTIVELSKTLGLTTLAEGVETGDQAWELRRLGAELGQGFHFARPLPLDELHDLVLRSRVLQAYANEVDDTSSRREAEWWDRTLRQR